MFKRRLERVAVTLLSVAVLLSSTGIASSLAANEISTSGSTTASSLSTTNSSTTVSQEGGAISTTTVTTEGGELVTENKGTGSISDPYRIADAEDFLAMQEKINLTTSANKYFVLTSDIDLSAIKAESFTSNSIYSGALVSVSKNLSNASKNVFFNLDGNGYKLKGLNVSASKGESLAIFGYVNNKSSIKNLTVENCVIKADVDVKNAAILVAENSGTIADCEIKNSILTLKNTANAGLIAAENAGTISNVQVTGTQSNVGGASATSHTISASGSVGAIAGTNSGKITGVSAINIGQYIDSSLTGKTIFGGIAGSSSGTISNSFASGNVVGGKTADVVGGLVGSAGKSAKLINNYALVALKCGASGNGLVGVGATSEMVGDCYWSSAISGRSSSVTNYGADVNDIDTLRFKTVKVGETVSIAKSVLATSWGKASFTISDEFKQNGSGITVSGTSVTGVTANKIAWFNYKTEIALPVTVGTGSLRIAQSFDLPILVVSASTQGRGTSSEPLVIGNSNEFNLLRYAHGVYAKLDKDISVNVSAFSFNGSFDGNGHIISISSPVFAEVSGSIKNVSFVSKSNISSAVLGNALNASVSNVAVSLNGATFNASGSNSGVMFNYIAGNTLLDNCRVKADVKIASDTTNFGALVGAVIGNGTTIKNSGASGDIAASKKATNAAIVIGSISASDVSIENCYVSGKNNAGKYAFVANIAAKDTAISNVYMSKGTQTPVDYSKADKSQFKVWSFNDGEVAFFTGKGGSFGITLPTIKAMRGATASDFTVATDSSLLSVALSVENGELVLGVSRASGVVTVKGCAVTVTNETTGLYTTVKISNGLEKDSAGNYIVSGAYDLAYISENIAELSKASFSVNSDIDMSELSSFEPIGGTLVPFSGKFNGNGHTISNLKINGTSKSGLFASLDGAEVKNLVISSAQISATGLYSAVLVGQINENTKISDVTVADSKVISDGIYSGIIAGSINSGSVEISEIRVENCTVNSKANYVGAVAGYASCDGKITNIEIKASTLSGAEYVAGVAGLAEGKLAISSVEAEGLKVSGISEVSGIAAGKGETTIADAKIFSSEISTVAETSAFAAGGISSCFGSSISGVEVRNSTVRAGIASSIVAKANADAKLSIQNANVYGTKVSAKNANTVAAGILAVHNSGGAVVINNCTVDEKTTITSTAVAAGIVGDITGDESALVAENIKSFAKVEVLSSGDAVASAGAGAKLSATALNNVQFKNVKILGEVSGNCAVGGFIGVIKGIGNFNGMTAVVSDSVCATQIKTDNTNKNAGVLIGAVENSKSVNPENIDSIITGAVISTYFGNVPAFGKSTEINASQITDMDKPNGSEIKPSVDTISAIGENEITLSNLPSVKGYAFDSATGWVSEADERISVVSSTESKLVLDVNHMADISVVAYYVSTADSDIRIPVHFAIKSNVRTPLNGKGTSASPYLISNAYDLESIAYYDTENKYFALASDIEFSAKDFEFGGAFYNVGNGVVTIGNAESGFKGTFTGLYNGKVHSINGLKLSGNVLGGLFGATDGAVISDIIIKNASVTGANYAGVLIGQAKDTVIKNITVEASSVASSEFGSSAGVIVGKAKNLTAENVKIVDSNATTTLIATSATIETAGGFAGIFDGKLSNVEMSNVTVNAGTYAGGAVGSAANAQLENVSFDGSVSAEISGGLIGSLKNPLDSFIKDSFVGGSVNGEKLGAGVIAEVGSDSTYISKADKPLVENTVIAAKANGSVSAAVIAKADKETFSDSDKAKTKILSEVYYSSYQNESVFGTQELNSYQNEGFTAVDLSAMSCVIGGTEKSFITLNGEKTVLGDNDIILPSGKGTYKSFAIGGHKFELDSVKSDPNGALTFDQSTSSIGVEGSVDGAKLVFNYTNGFVTAIPVAYSSLLSGSGTKADPYRVGTADEFAVMMQNNAAGTYYVLTNDIDLSGVSAAESFSGILDGQNHVVYDFTGESLFASVSGTIKNVGFVGFDIDSKTETAVGAVAGELNGAMIESCVVIADINAIGKAQDAGIVAGRAMNGTVITNSITSGIVRGGSLLAAGGLFGEANNAQISSCVSTAYVSSGGYAGGLVGEADYVAMSNSVFANMVASSSKKGGNIVGRFAATSSAENVSFDSCTSKDDSIVAEGATESMKASTTKALADATIVGFTATDSGYAVPSTLKSTESSAKFTTAVEFAALAVKYLSGSNAGTATSYTGIKVPAEVNSNSVSVDRSHGLVITLMKNKDYNSADNLISRFSYPVSDKLTAVTYSISDKSGSLDGKLIGVMLKTKLDNSANSFGFFTKVGSDEKAVNSVNVTEGGIYVDLSLPKGYGYSVKAVTSDGKSLKVSDRTNEGNFIATDNSESINISIKIKEEKTDWGLRTIWSVIGK